MAPHSSTLAWKIPWMEEPGGLPSLGSHRVGHDWSDLAATAEGWDGGGGGERLKREGIYVYIKLIQVVVQQKLTQHCKATIFQKKFLRKQKKMARYIIVVSRAGSVYIWCKSIENLTERSSQIEVSGFQEQARIGKSKNKQPGLLGWFGWYFWGLGSSSVFLLQLEGGGSCSFALCLPRGHSCVTSTSQAGGPLWCPQRTTTHIISELCHLSFKESGEARVFSWALCFPEEMKAGRMVNR